MLELQARRVCQEQELCRARQVAVPGADGDRMREEEREDRRAAQAEGGEEPAPQELGQRRRRCAISRQLLLLLLLRMPPVSSEAPPCEKSLTFRVLRANSPGSSDRALHRARLPGATPICRSNRSPFLPVLSCTSERYLLLLHSARHPQLLPHTHESHTVFILSSAARLQAITTQGPARHTTDIYQPGMPALRCEKPNANQGRYMPTKT